MITYKDAGVDVERGYEAVNTIKSHVQSTFTKHVLTDIGSFGGAFSLGAFKDMEEPVLISGTDGVGTKLKLAFDMDKHDTIGIDLVAMCVNDILCCGAKPLFFLDYIATAHIEPERIGQIVEGISDGCKQSGCSLVGGETAEMPSMYSDGEYDAAGFVVGIVDKKNMIDGSTLTEGDILIGLSSSGVHSNGYSLVRKLIEISGVSLDEHSDQLGETYGEAFLRPTKIYVETMAKLQEQIALKAVSHITGGGFIENVPRMLKDGVSAKIDISKIDKPKVYDFIEEASKLDVAQLYNTFNMGVGMVVVVAKEDADKALQIVGEEGTIIGEIVQGNKGVILCSEGDILCE